MFAKNDIWEPFYYSIHVFNVTILFTHTGIVQVFYSVLKMPLEC